MGRACDIPKFEDMQELRVLHFQHLQLELYILFLTVQRKVLHLGQITINPIYFVMLQVGFIHHSDYFRQDFAGLFSADTGKINYPFVFARLACRAHNLLLCSFAYLWTRNLFGFANRWMS